VTDHGRLDEATVAAMVPEWTVSDRRARLRAAAPSDAPSAALVVQNLTSVGDLDDLCVLADGALDAAGTRGIDTGGWSAVGDEVVVWDAGEERATVSRAAFVDLLRRLVDLALTHRDDAVDVDDRTWSDLQLRAGELAGE
jgi:hypothetical protein